MSDWVQKQLERIHGQKGKKGGPGSGHWGHAGRPGKRGGSLPGSVAVSIRTGRTARERQQSAAAGGLGTAGVQPRHIGRISKELFDKWDKQVQDEWDGPRGGMAGAALWNCHSQWSDMEAIAIEEDGELKAIIAVRDPSKKYNYLTGEWDPPEPGEQLTADYLASKERGYGTRMLRSAIQRAADNDWGLVFSATDKSKPFYLKLGLRSTSEGSTLFSLTEGDVKRWLKTGKM